MSVQVPSSACATDARRGVIITTLPCILACSQIEVEPPIVAWLAATCTGIWGVLKDTGAWLVFSRHIAESPLFTGHPRPSLEQRYWAVVAAAAAAASAAPGSTVRWGQYTVVQGLREVKVQGGTTGDTMSGSTLLSGTLLSGTTGNTTGGARPLPRVLSNQGYRGALEPAGSVDERQEEDHRPSRTATVPQSYTAQSYAPSAVSPLFGVTHLAPRLPVEEPESSSSEPQQLGGELQGPSQGTISPAVMPQEQAFRPHPFSPYHHQQASLDHATQTVADQPAAAAPPHSGASILQRSWRWLWSGGRRTTPAATEDASAIQRAVGNVEGPRKGQRPQVVWPQVRSG
jgi:hypothetical protein